jgi:hypothetical protein
LVQPPKYSSMVKVWTFGKSLAYFASSAAERGLSWCLAAISWASSLHRNFR